MTSKPMKGSAQEVLGVTKGGWGVVHSPGPKELGVGVRDPSGGVPRRN